MKERRKEVEDRSIRACIERLKKGKLAPWKVEEALVTTYNIEVGVVSSREGLVSPVGREAMRIMGIRTAKDFAASVAAQVLAGEFNLALEISREKLYS